MILRRAALSDADVIAAVDAASCEHPWSEASYRADLERPLSYYWLLEADHQPSCVGFIGVHLLGDSDDAEVLNLVVVPEQRRKGYARRLLTVAIETVREAGVAKLFLEVAAHNVAARALYKALGFVEYGIRPRYYGNDDARLLVLVFD